MAAPTTSGITFQSNYKLRLNKTVKPSIELHNATFYLY